MNNNIMLPPLYNESLDNLKDNIYQQQFFDYDETVDAKKVLDALQNLDKNPALLNYVIKCLAKQNISTRPDKFYAVVVNAEHRPEYNESIHQSFEKYMKYCVDGDFDLKKRDFQINQVFRDITEIENQMMKREGEDITGFGNTNFQKYTIHEIGTQS